MACGNPTSTFVQSREHHSLNASRSKNPFSVIPTTHTRPVRPEKHATVLNAVEGTRAVRQMRGRLAEARAGQGWLTKSRHLQARETEGMALRLRWERGHRRARREQEEQ